MAGGIGVENSTLVVSARLVEGNVAPEDALAEVARSETLSAGEAEGTGSTEATGKKININNNLFS